MSTAPTAVHSVIGGNLDHARLFGLTVIAKCGKVWVPVDEPSFYRARAAGLPDCEECYNDLPHRLTIDPHVVYRCYDEADRLIYVGCTWSPKQRLEQHSKTSWWYPQTARTRLLVFPNKEYALWKEREAIGEENPRWNVKGRVRGLWQIDDYADYLYALKQNGASDSRLDKVRDEARRRFDVDLDDIEVAA